MEAMVKIEGDVDRVGVRVRVMVTLDVSGGVVMEN